MRTPTSSGMQLCQEWELACSAMSLWCSCTPRPPRSPSTPTAGHGRHCRRPTGCVRVSGELGAMHAGNSENLRVRELVEHDRDLAHGGEEREDGRRRLLAKVLLVRGRGERVERGHSVLRAGPDADEAGLRERAGRGAVGRERGGGRGHAVWFGSGGSGAPLKRQRVRGAGAVTGRRTHARRKARFSRCGCGSRWQKGVMRAKAGFSRLVK